MRNAMDRRTWKSRVLGSVMLLTALGLVPVRAEDDGNAIRLAEYYGFLSPEIYKLDSRISNLIVADFDGDGIEDIAVANNARSRIDLLLSTPGPADETGGFGTGPNRLGSDRRLRIKTILVNKEVVSLQAGDFNGNGKTDLAFYGTPAELVILFNQGEARFGPPRRISTGNAIESSSALAVGDLNRDGRDDLALLTSGEVVTILQTESGDLAPPERLPHTGVRPGILKLVDLDGDGGDDIVILAGGDDTPIRVRFSRPGGTLGPEERFRIEPPRAIAFAALDNEPGVEVLTIESQSGRARVLTLEEGAEEDDRPGRLIFYPLPPGSARGRALALGDLDGDGRIDVVVTDPETAQLIVYRSESEGGLGTSQMVPGLLGGRAIRMADLNGDGRDDVLVLSEREKQIGWSRFEDDRLTFPNPLPIEGGEPVALDVADLDGDGNLDVLYVAKARSGGSDTYTLRALKHEGDEGFAPLQWASGESLTLEGLNGSPKDLRVLDINRDGHPDILVFNPFGAPILFLGRPDGEAPSLYRGSAGPLSGVEPSGLTTSTLDGEPASIVAQSQNSFARHIELGENNQWQVLDQFSPGRSSAQIQASVALDINGDGKEEIVLLDRTTRSLLILETSDTGVYRLGPTLPIGSIDFQGLHVADLDGDGRDDLLIAGTEKFGVVLTGGQGRRLKGIATYETTREDARLADLIAGDVNDDGRMDVIMTDTIEHFLEIAAFDGSSGLERALSFKVFEQKSFRGLDDLIEPREIALGDVDGDGRTDIVLIVHDRVLVFRQDPGPMPTSTAAPRAKDSNDEDKSEEQPADK